MRFRACLWGVLFLSLCLVLADTPSFAQTTAELFTQANQLTNAKKYREAARVYQLILQREPKNLSALQGLGLNYLFLKKYDQSARALQEVIREDPRNVRTLMTLGYLYETQGIFYEALFYYDRVLKLDPYHLDAYWGKGRVFNKDRQYRNAIEVFRKALELDPYHKGVLQNLSAAYRGIEFYEAAAETEKKILEVYPKDFETLMRVAQHYEALKDMQNAILWYEKAKEVNPGNETVHVHLALLYRRALEIDSYITALEQAIQIQEANIENYVLLGRVYGWTWRLEEGIEVYKKALKMDPTNVKALNGLGDLYLKTGAWDEAESHFKRVLTLDPKDADALAGMNKVALEKRPLYITRYNRDIEKNKPLPINSQVERINREDQFSNEFEYRFSPSFSIEGRYQLNRQYQDILAGDREYEYQQEIWSLKFQQKFKEENWLKLIAFRPSFVTYQNRGNNTYKFKEPKDRISAFAFAYLSVDQFFSVPSIVRGLLVLQRSPDILRVTNFLNSGISLGYNFTSDLQSIIKYNFVEFQQLNDSHEAETTLTYRLPFWEKRIQVGYGFDWLSKPLERKHTVTSRFKDRLILDILTDLKYDFSVAHKKVDAGLTYVHTLDFLFSVPLYKKLTFNFNGVWEAERNKDHDFEQNYRLFLEVPLGIF